MARQRSAIGMSVVWALLGLAWFVRDLLVRNDGTSIPRFVIGSVFLLLAAVTFLDARRNPPGRAGPNGDREPDDGTDDSKGRTDQRPDPR
jgi:hypothetical protein